MSRRKLIDPLCDVTKAGRTCHHPEAVHVPARGSMPAHCTKCRRGPIQAHRFAKREEVAA